MADEAGVGDKIKIDHARRDAMEDEGPRRRPPVHNQIRP
jgi:hypothetical protein